LQVLTHGKSQIPAEHTHRNRSMRNIREGIGINADANNMWNIPQTLVDTIELPHSHKNSHEKNRTRVNKKILKPSSPFAPNGIAAHSQR
jgi:hypothetical protein